MEQQFPQPATVVAPGSAEVPIDNLTLVHKAHVRNHQCFNSTVNENVFEMIWILAMNARLYTSNFSLICVQILFESINHDGYKLNTCISIYTNVLKYFVKAAAH